MNWRLAVILVGVTGLGGDLSAQQPEVVIPDRVGSREARLFTGVQLERPTIIILVPASIIQLKTGALDPVLRAADSLADALGSVAHEAGYRFEIRAIAHAHIHDPGANAYHAASQSVEGFALVIARPGSTPRLIRSWPSPEKLDQELRDYERVFRPLIPT